MKVTDEQRDGKDLKELADILDLNGNGVQVTTYEGEIVLRVDSVTINAPRAVLDIADAEYLAYSIYQKTREARQWQDTH